MTAAPFLSIQIATSPDQKVRVHYRSDHGLEVADGSVDKGVWHFPQPAASGPLLATAVVLSKEGDVVRTSRPIDPSRHPQLSESGAGFHHVSKTAAQIAQALDRRPRLTVSIYAVAGGVLALGAAYSLYRGFSTHEPLRFALAVILVGFGALLGYEAVATTRLRPATAEPTIARIVSGAFLRHPAVSWAILTGVCLLVGALIVHFTRVNGVQFWTVGVAIAAFVAGSVVGTDRWLSLLK